MYTIEVRCAKTNRFLRHHNVDAKPSDVLRVLALLRACGRYLVSVMQEG
jgi:hypothetical protein